MNQTLLNIRHVSIATGIVIKDAMLRESTKYCKSVHTHEIEVVYLLFGEKHLLKSSLDCMHILN